MAHIHGTELARLKAEVSVARLPRAAAVDGRGHLVRFR
ncbi:hypothetical protein ABH924_001446 [Arthrobacter sp. GAS37]